MRTVRWSNYLKIVSLLTVLLFSLGMAHAPWSRVTWKVIDTDYLRRTIMVKDIFGLEGRHVLVLPYGAPMPVEGFWYEGAKDYRYYYINIHGEWYYWER